MLAGSYCVGDSVFFFGWRGRLCPRFLTCAPAMSNMEVSGSDGGK